MISTLDRNERILFGKHSGTPIRNLDAGYLRWMVKQGDEFHNKEWQRKAAEELVVRNGSREREAEELLAKLDATIEHTMLVMTDVEDLTRTPSKLVRVDTSNTTTETHVQGIDPYPTVEEGALAPLTRIPRDRRIALRRKAIDDISRFLLKEFILRKDKEQGITGWAEEFVQEVMKCGGNEVVTQGKGMIDYLGHTYHFDLTDPLRPSLTQVTNNAQEKKNV